MMVFVFPWYVDGDVTDSVRLWDVLCQQEEGRKGRRKKTRQTDCVRLWDVLSQRACDIYVFVLWSVLL